MNQLTDQSDSLPDQDMSREIADQSAQLEGTQSEKDQTCEAKIDSQSSCTKTISGRSLTCQDGTKRKGHHGSGDDSTVLCMTCQLAILILVVSALTLSPISVVMIFVKIWKKGYDSKGVSY
jgi:hypothetical protein